MTATINASAALADVSLYKFIADHFGKHLDPHTHR
jgi:hypothetical protein